MAGQIVRRVSLAVKNLIRLLIFAILYGTLVGFAAVDPSSGVQRNLFQPGGATHAALSPDGRYLAHADSGVDLLRITIVDLDEVDPPVVLSIGRNDSAPEARGIGLLERSEWVPRISSMQWANPRQLVYAREIMTNDRHQYEEMRIVDADGKNDRLLADQTMVEFVRSNAGGTARTARGPRLIGSSHDNPGLFIFGTDGNNPMLPDTRFSVDLATRKIRRISDNHPALMLYDWTGRERLQETERAAPDGRQVYQRRRPGTFGGWQNFDEWLGSAAGVAFAHTDEDYLGERSIPLAFDRDPDLLYFASNVGRDTYGIYALDLRTRRRTDFVVEDDGFDLVDYNRVRPGSSYLAKGDLESPLIFDRNYKLVGIRLAGVPSRTRWLEPKLARLQEQFNARFAGRRVEIIDWDADIRRVVALVSGPGDPGRFILYQSGAPGRMAEIAERAPWLPVSALHESKPFAFVTPEGVRLGGTLTIPRAPRVKNPPLVVVCPELSWWDRGAFDRQAQMLAFSGFLVMRVHYRGIAGMGKEHRDALKGSPDRVPIADIRAAIDWLASQQNFDRKRIALLGEGFGGYVALRALQLYPGEFRTAVTFNAPVDLALWTAPERARGQALPPLNEVVRRNYFGGDRKRLQDLSVSAQIEALTKPVYILRLDMESAPANPQAIRSAEIVTRLQSQGVDSEYAEITRGLGFHLTDSRGARRALPRVVGLQYAYLPSSHTATAEWNFRNSEEIQKSVQSFLMAQLYDFSAQVGQEKVVE